MAEQTVRVHGLRELTRALKKAEGDLDKELRTELKAAAEIVAVRSRELFQRINPVSASGYKPRVRRGGAVVEQSKRRTTGQRPDYGVLQMNIALLPALEQKEGEVINRVERMLDTLGRQNGF